jgi:hypothetical protein
LVLRILNLPVDFFGELNTVCIVRAADNSPVPMTLVVQATKICAVKRQDRPLFLNCNIQDKTVVFTVARFADVSLPDSDHVMSKQPQLINRALGEVLIREELRHSLDFIRSDLQLNLARIVFSMPPSGV